MISNKVAAAINEQIGNEFGASLQYVAIASFFASEGLVELAARFYTQADEERMHAMKFVKYLVDAGAQVEIPKIPAPKGGFKSAAEAVKLSLEWEKTVTDQINRLAKLAAGESDYLTANFLNWFVNEQLEEVSSMDNLYRTIKRAGEDNLIYVESYLARTAGKPVTSQGSAT
jgi:ferritin